jgi:hypothetical protein
MVQMSAVRLLQTAVELDLEQLALDTMALQFRSLTRQVFVGVLETIVYKRRINGG